MLDEATSTTNVYWLQMRPFMLMLGRGVELIQRMCYTFCVLS